MTTEEPRQEEQGPLHRTSEAVDWWLKKWGRAEPLTWEYVERLIKVNGGTAEGLYLVSRDLQGAILWYANLQGARLWRANLQGAILNGANLQGANLMEAHLQGAILRGANLQSADLLDAKLQGAHLTDANLQGADLRRANLQGAHLSWANLRGTDLRLANLDGANLEGASMEGVRLYEATITETTKLRRVLWGEKMTLGDEAAKEWGQALDPYRDLKQWHQRTGDYDTADRFHYREWECRRKLAQERKRPVEILELWLYRLLFGYGDEHPRRVITVSAALVLLFALFYMPWSQVDITTVTGARGLFTYSWKALYFSGVSFTALGYGGWLEGEGVVPTGWSWTKYLGVVESLFGISLIALFLVTFTRKLVR